MKSANILIVEDSFIVSFHLQSTLESEGYTVVGKCDSGEQALRVAESNPVDLVLMDIMLVGKLDGIETATILKEKFGIPVVYITALTDKKTIKRAKVTEPFGYLTKPFEDREIFTIIEMALYKHEIEVKLKQSEEKYFSTVNSIGDAVVAIDRDYCISFMNQSAMAMTQWTINDALGKSVTEVLNLRNENNPEEPVNPIQCEIGMGALNRMPEDLRLNGKNGLVAPIGESSLSPMMDSKGNFVGLIIVFKDLTEKIEHNKLLEEIDRQRIAAIIEGQEKERARIAKDLHDGLGQMLNAIKMNIHSVLSNKEESLRLGSLLDDAIQESVRISENLLPAKLKDFDLDTCLKSLCNNCNQSNSIQIQFDSHDESFQMSQVHKVNLYRIAQEAINNALKHAKANTINVHLEKDKDSIRLIIEDNGHGLPAVVDERNGHNGLVNMRDRAEIMGGKFSIDSKAENGTRIMAEVPIENLLQNV
jgi:PAS domain S-box-containing protein